MSGKINSQQENKAHRLKGQYKLFDSYATYKTKSKQVEHTSCPTFKVGGDLFQIMFSAAPHQNKQNS